MLEKEEGRSRHAITFCLVLFVGGGGASNLKDEIIFDYLYLN